MKDYGPKDMKKIRKNRRRKDPRFNKPITVIYVGEHKAMAVAYAIPYWLNPPYVDTANGRVTKQWRQIVYLIQN